MTFGWSDVLFIAAAVAVFYWILGRWPRVYYAIGAVLIVAVIAHYAWTGTL